MLSQKRAETNNALQAQRKKVLKLWVRSSIARSSRNVTLQVSWKVWTSKMFKPHGPGLAARESCLNSFHKTLCIASKADVIIAPWAISNARVLMPPKRNCLLVLPMRRVGNNGLFCFLTSKSRFGSIDMFAFNYISVACTLNMPICSRDLDVQLWDAKKIL